MDLPLLIVVTMLLLAAGFVGTRLAALARLPHSVFLVVLGLLTGLLVRGLGGDFRQHLDESLPHLILYVLLPPLVFESSYNLDGRQLKRDLLPISALAVVAMIASTFLVGYGLHHVFGLELLPSLTFGALISATDPIAVIALFKEVGAPKRLQHLIEAESLLNDATAIALFRVLLISASAAMGGFDLARSIGGHMLLAAFGGIVTGIGFGLICRLLLRFTAPSAAAQMGLTLVACYLSFITADAYLDLSGVIATMTVGLMLGRTAHLEPAAEAHQGTAELWEFLALSANIVVFFAVGFTVDWRLFAAAASFVPLTLLIVFLARGLSVFTTMPLVNRLKIAEPVPNSYQAVLVWGGLRGGLALALVLTLPPSFPHRALFLELAIAVVLFTLLVNAVTAKKVLRILGLAGP